MRAPSTALLYALSSLVLVQAFAAAPLPQQQSSSKSARAKGIDAREAIRWLESQRTEDTRPTFSVRMATSDRSSSSTDLMAPRDPHPTTDITTTPVEPREESTVAHTESFSALVEVRDEKALTDSRAVVDGSHHEPLLSAARHAAPLAPAPAPAELGQNLEYRTVVVRSAAPKILGVNMFLIIAWLVFVYLMYRTGSI